MEQIRANYQLVRGLRHSNIVAVTNLEQDRNGDYYLVMDLARGESLSRWMRHHPSATETEKLGILRQIASALDYAHAMKIVHRDVKPENVMVDADGTVMVLDFGLAAEIRSSQSRTSHAVTSKSGTLHYKAPEQWLGRPQRAPADIYSFAVLAYKLLIGELPFDADDPVVLGQAVLNAPVPKVPGVPACVNVAFAKGLAKKPEDRFATCTQFVDALEGKVKTASSCSLVKWLAVGAFALIGALGAAYWLGRSNAPSGRASAPRSPSASERARGTRAPTGYAPVAVQADAPRSPSASERARVPRGRAAGETTTVTLPGGAKLELVWCPKGEFMMGSPTTEDGRLKDETQHRVKLTKGFWIGKYEVTQEQWESVMNSNPSHFKGIRRPVENVPWNDCRDFCQKAGHGLRLPTEAEWEYACRAGSTTAYCWGNALNGDRANCDGNYPYGTTEKGPYKKETTDVGSYPSGKNAWGIYDMHGNVWEWCQDWYGDYPDRAVTDPKGPTSGLDRVSRGGSWGHYAWYCRSAGRFGPSISNSFLGFRVCCSAGLSE